MDKYIDWNACHKGYEEADDISSPWHVFIKENLNLARDISSKIVLEIGCGRGGVSKYLSSLQPPARQLYGCDYSEKAIEIARERYGHIDHLKWQKQDIQNITFEDNFFDTIVSCETVEHVPDPKKALQELYRVLKKGGALYLTHPNYFNLVGLWCIYRKAIGKPYTEGGQPLVKYLLLPTMFKWFKQIGFEVELFYSGGIVLPVPPFRFFKDKNPMIFKYLGLHAFYILRK